MKHTEKELKKRQKQLQDICKNKCTAKHCDPLCIHCFELADIEYQLQVELKAEKDITDYFQKDWRKYLESEEGKKYLEEINKNYDRYLDGKE